jgi:hypothetical protein
MRDPPDTDWERGLDLTLRLRNAFVALCLGWISSSATREVAARY